MSGKRKFQKYFKTFHKLPDEGVRKPKYLNFCNQKLFLTSHYSDNKLRDLSISLITRASCEDSCMPRAKAHWELDWRWIHKLLTQILSSSWTLCACWCTTIEQHPCMQAAVIYILFTPTTSSKKSEAKEKLFYSGQPFLDRTLKEKQEEEAKASNRRKWMWIFSFMPSIHSSHKHLFNAFIEHVM